jgi:L-2-hydroxyglutarate oxidase LhgO
MPEHDVIVVGGGCVGCSTAKHLAENRGLNVALVEKEFHLAQHQSGRNSGVLHPGFNYEPGSTKARFATEGTSRMKEYAHDRDIPLREFGVVVVATTPEEERHLSTIQRQADANGVETEIIGPAELEEHEPHARGRAALYCPEAASVDSQQYVYELANDAKRADVDFYMGHTVQGITTTPSTVEVTTDKGTVTGEYLINAAGLYSDTLAAEVGVGSGYRIVPFRGDYYELTPESSHLCNTMIYPTPDPDLPFLGVHYTRRTDGKVIVGPNAVLAFAREAYRNTDFDLGELGDILEYRGFWKLLASPKMLGIAWEELNKSYRKEKFVEASQQLVPAASEEDFVRSYAGVRAQLVSEGGELIKDPMVRAGPRSLHVLNAVSPGLTCSLPFGEHIADRAIENL